MTTANDPQQIKACCAAAYGSDLVALLLGDSYHPGGLALTRHLATRLGLNAGERVLDVAAGRGTTALLLASEYGVHVDAVDLSAANVALATAAADAAGLATQLAFSQADAERLPYPDAAFDAVLCECALCTFPDKPTAARELARVLRPGGHLGITDVTADPARLPDQLTSPTGWIACIADARPLDQYTQLLVDAGLTITHTECHNHALARMIDQIEARLSLVRITARDRAERLRIDTDRAGALLTTARAAVASDALGYGLIIAQRPGEHQQRQHDR